MEMGELQVDQMTNKMKAWGAKKAADPDGWARSEWQQTTPEILKPMRDMMTEMEETVEKQDAATIDEGSCGASSCKYGCSCTDTEESEPNASALGPPTNHGHVLSTSSSGAKRGYPSLWWEE